MRTTDTRLLRELHDQLAHLITPIEVHNVLSRRALPILAAAALIDFVRSTDEKKLDEEVRRVVVFGIERVAFRARVARELKSKGSTADLKLDEVDRICEVQDLRHLLSFSATAAKEREAFRPAPRRWHGVRSLAEHARNSAARTSGHGSSSTSRRTDPETDTDSWAARTAGGIGPTGGGAGKAMTAA